MTGTSSWSLAIAPNDGLGIGQDTQIGGMVLKWDVIVAVRSVTTSSSSVHCLN